MPRLPIAERPSCPRLTRLPSPTHQGPDVLRDHWLAPGARRQLLRLDPVGRDLVARRPPLVFRAQCVPPYLSPALSAHPEADLRRRPTAQSGPCPATSSRARRSRAAITFLPRATARPAPAALIRRLGRPAGSSREQRPARARTAPSESEHPGEPAPSAMGRGRAEGRGVDLMLGSADPPLGLSSLSTAGHIHDSDCRSLAPPSAPEVAVRTMRLCVPVAGGRAGWSTRPGARASDLAPGRDRSCCCPTSTCSTTNPPPDRLADPQETVPRPFRLRPCL